LRALVEISLAYNERKLISAKEIAKLEGIPIKYLEQILSNLKLSGFVVSEQGAKGGYSLARPPHEITFGEVIRSLEGTLSPIGCVDLKDPKFCSELWHCRFHQIMTKLRQAISEVVDNTTLADVCR
jgi:Rrf2 family protein